MTKIVHFTPRCREEWPKVEKAIGDGAIRGWRHATTSTPLIIALILSAALGAFAPWIEDGGTAAFLASVTASISYVLFSVVLLAAQSGGDAVKDWRRRSAEAKRWRSKSCRHSRLVTQWQAEIDRATQEIGKIEEAESRARQSWKHHATGHTPCAIHLADNVGYHLQWIDELSKAISTPIQALPTQPWTAAPPFEGEPQWTELYIWPASDLDPSTIPPPRWENDQAYFETLEKAGRQANLNAVRAAYWQHRQTLLRAKLTKRRIMRRRRQLWRKVDELRTR